MYNWEFVSQFSHSASQNSHCQETEIRIAYHYLCAVRITSVKRQQLHEIRIAHTHLCAERINDNRLWVIKDIKANGVLEIEAPYSRRIKLVTTNARTTTATNNHRHEQPPPRTTHNQRTKKEEETTEMENGVREKVKASCPPPLSTALRRPPLPSVFSISFAK
ncbi:uncharacterized protein HKW66_Vig0017290 [Vigna angularis]|uniref:Uncharacterized protein n=1 Tax=Phaseolus angularis TaxID=3914 RepID=A0A8T0LG94_PHAAN|nr:uncharacterized protein HKW66_Vig0017290 [Vigna angularis]